MKNTGLYFINRSKTLNDNQWSRHALCCNDEPVCTSIEETDNNGVIIVHNKLYCNGEEIAEASIDQPCRIDENGKFGDVDLLGHTTCINITKEDYITLYSGGKVVGYKKYDPLAVYNIVEDVATAPVVTCVKPENLKDGLYNNLSGELPDNTLTDATFTNINTPQLSVHDFTLRVKPTGNIKLTYMVDSKYCNKLMRKATALDDTFTVIIKDSYGKELYKNTTYGGAFDVTLPVLTDNNGNNLPSGTETWFSVECIDSNHVGSAVRYCDVFVTDFDDVSADVYEIHNIYEMTEADLTAYGITLNDDDDVKAYKNKKGFTDLFQAVADGTHDGTKYDGIKLYNPTNKDVYYINYHANIGNDQDNPDFGTQTYYVYKVVNHAIVGEPQTIVQGGTIQIDNDYAFDEDSGMYGIDDEGYQEYSVDVDPYQFIRHDGAHLCRVTKDFSDAHAHIYDNKVYVTPADIGKIWVRWRDDGKAWDAAGITRQPNVIQYKPEIELFRGFHTRNWGQYDGVHANTHGLSNIYRILVTRRVSVITSQTELNKLPNGYYYVVLNTAVGGDDIVYPDNFIIDFNQATWKATYCDDLHSGHIIYFNDVFNTHFRNGKIEGTFKTVDFARNHLSRGYTWDTNGIGEDIHNIKSYGAKWCSFYNMESCYSLCYEAQNKESTTVTIYGSLSESNFSFDELGYIDNEGSIKSAEPIREDITTPNNCGDAESLVYESTYFSLTNFKVRRRDNIARPASSFTLHSIYTMPYNSSKQHELFISFYKKVGIIYTFIKTVKTRWYYPIKIPNNATHFRITAYGVSELDNDTRVSAIKTYNNGISINGAFYKFNVSCFPDTLTKGIIYKDCYWHDTRSTAISMEGCLSGLWDGCTYKTIAGMSYTDWFITKLLGATEDGRQNVGYMTVKNCEVIRTLPGGQIQDYPTDQSSFKFIYGQSITVKNNVGFGINKGASVESAYIYNNICPYVAFYAGTPIPAQHLLFKNNDVYEEFKADTSSDLNMYATSESDVHDYYRTNNCDDEISTEFAVENTYALYNNPNSNSTTVPIYIRSKIEDEIYD